MNNDVNMFLGIDDNGVVYKNGVQVYNKNQGWDQTVNFVIPDVNNNDNITIQCQNGGGPGAIGLFYLWGGAVFSLPQNNIDGFNSSVNIINFNAKNNYVNTNDYTYHQNGRGYFNLMQNWLYTNSSTMSFTINFQAITPELSSQISNLQTDWNSEGGGNALYLGNHDIKCNNNSGMSRFHLNRQWGSDHATSTGKYNYIYRCKKDDNLTDKE
jgi:hypothetical protein